MASFLTQVQSLTSLTVDTGELTQFLNDGVIDVTNRCIAMKPQNAEKFSRRSGLTTTQGYDPGGANIISVIRESGTADDWRPCMKTSPALQSRVTDTNSLYFASAYNPVFTVEDDGKIYVYPAPGSSPNGYKVYFVNTSPIDGAGNALAQDDSTIGSFPNDKVYLVVIYAGIKCLGAELGNKMGSYTINAVPPEAPVVPDSPSLTVTTVVAQTAGGLGTAPTYTVATHSAASLTSSSQTFDIDQFREFLEDDEDTELAAGQMTRLQLELGEYQADIQKNAAEYATEMQEKLGKYNADIQNNLNEFNEDNAVYQASLQTAVQNLQIAGAKAQKDADLEAQREIQEYTLKLQRYQQEVAEYQSQVGLYQIEATTQLQDYSSKYQWLQDQQVKLMTEYAQAFQIMAGPQPAKTN